MNTDVETIYSFRELIFRSHKYTANNWNLGAKTNVRRDKTEGKNLNTTFISISFLIYIVLESNTEHANIKYKSQNCTIHVPNVYERMFTIIKYNTN